ncbi:putative LRR receptor-like serine/threonine-protein kinase [Hordeum vulgare]|nr:putative LRR receptor-like serine/threonine-protein kinase [Hordeum vulgare]
MTPAGRSLAPLVVLLLVLHWVALGEAATAAERRILLDFKSAITADPDGALASWAPSADPCADYAGMSCDPATGAVQRLRLHGAGLAGTLAPSLARLPGPRVCLALRERALRRDPCGVRGPFAHAAQAQPQPQRAVGRDPGLPRRLPLPPPA